jgi:homogentisate 1,2-dioxygenase
MVSLAYRRRTIPIARTWLKQVRGHSSAEKQIELLKYVKTLLPKKAVVFLVGDSEFGSVTVLKELNQWKWLYALRQKSNTGFRVGAYGDWQPLESFAKSPATVPGYQKVS